MLTCLSSALPGQTSEALKAKIDAVIASAYQSASAQFPCKLKTRGKYKMLHWQQIDKCLNYAGDRIEWQEITEQLEQLRKEYRLQENEIESLIDKSIAAQALPFDKVFIVKQEKARLPLSTSVLKFLPENSLEGLPIFDESGEQIGTFGGTYHFERTGTITGNKIRHPLFQYADPQGNMHSVPDRLLLDSFGVPWKDAAGRPGFRLPLHSIMDDFDK